MFFRHIMPPLMILILISGCVTLCSCISRHYYLINALKPWTQAQNYCREHYTDLATIGSLSELERLWNITHYRSKDYRYWIGLKNTGPVSWMWSVGETSVGPGLVERTNWTSSPDSSHYCGGMRTDGKWLSASCETTLPFVCQRAEGEVYVVLQNKTWWDAQQYCRLNYTDLASVRNNNHSRKIHEIIHGDESLSLVWIGLFRDGFKWSDGSNSSFRYWWSHTYYCPYDYYHPYDYLYGCVVSHMNMWHDAHCGRNYYFICYSSNDTEELLIKIKTTKAELPKEKRSVMTLRLKVKSNSSSNFDDEAVGEAILKEVQKKLKGAKVQWKVQKDGKIFKKEEKEKEAEMPYCKRNFK